jgi:hypothetical protein
MVASRSKQDAVLSTVHPDRHIMFVTGHKAESSLKTYTGYTDSKTKQKMSNALSSVLRSSDNNVQQVDTYKAQKSCEQYSRLHPACFDLLPLSDSQEHQEDLKTLLKALDIFCFVLLSV